MDVVVTLENIKMKRKKGEGKWMLNKLVSPILSRTISLLLSSFYERMKKKTVSFLRNEMCCCCLDFGEAMQTIDTVKQKRRNKVMDKSELANENNMNKCAW